MAISDELQQARVSAPVGEIIVDTLEIRHASFSAPIRLCKYNTDLTLTLEASAPEDASTAVTFTKAGFELTLPRKGNDGFQTLSLALGNIDKNVQQHLEIASTNPGPITCIFRQYLLSDTTAPAIDPPATLQIEGAVADMFAVNAQAQSENWLNSNVHSVLYNLENFPGLRTA